MVTENLSILKIHKLTQSQYDREVASGDIDPNALYLTPEEEIDLTTFGVTVTKDELNKLDGVASNVQTQLNNKIDSEFYDEEIDMIKNSINSKAPAYSYGTTDLIAGVSSLATGKLYFVYE